MTLRRTLALALCALIGAPGLDLATAPRPAEAAGLCAAAGKDGAGGTLSGIVNAYYPGLASAGSGSTAIAVGAATGANSAIATGDLLLVVQMQNAAINTSNTSAYGSGGTSANGFTSATAGTYEYVVARGSVGTGGGTISISGANGGGLINSYYAAAASSLSGQQTFQVVRVPQYTSATLGALTAAAWNGASGGIVALDVQGTLTGGGGSIALSGLGFRGGGRQILRGIATGVTNTDYVNVSGQGGNAGAHASKAEGIAGTPRFTWTGTTENDAGTAFEGYPGGSFARGAPGNAGGGGTDSRPGTNDQNSGGGGGGNGGTGGTGGNAWNSGAAVGGVGGAAFPYATTPQRLILGGGGGAGVSNDGTNAGTAPGSMGGVGGGIAFVRAGVTSGNATISANGTAGTEPIIDGGGGGGAGGSIVFVAGTTGLLSTFAFNAVGGAGANADNAANQPAHGPGGGGSGGALLTNSAALLGSSSVAGGANGVTGGNNNAFGATSGAAGYSTTAFAPANVPGAQAGYACTASSFLNVAKSGPATAPPGGLIAYTIVVSNGGPADASGTTFSDPVPSGIIVNGTPTCAAAGGATCGAVAVSGQTVTSTITTLPSGGSVTFTIDAKSSTNATYTNTATIAPGTGVTNGNTATTSSATTTVAATYGPNKTVQNITTGESTAGTSDNASPGDVLQYGLSFTNTTNAPVTSFKFTDTIPTNTTFAAATYGTLPSGVTSAAIAAPAVGATGVVTWTFVGTIAVGSTVTATLRVTVK